MYLLIFIEVIPIFKCDTFGNNINFQIWFEVVLTADNKGEK